MTWAEFKALVRTLMSVDANRIGIQAYVDATIRLGVLDLQSYVPGLCEGQETRFTDEDVILVDKASQGVLDNPIKVRGLWLLTPADPLLLAPTDPEALGWARIAPEVLPWERRHEVAGGFKCNTIALDFRNNQFLVFPALSATNVLLVQFDGKKLEYAEDDPVPLGEPEAEAVAEYVLARIARLVDKNDNAFASHKQEYGILRRKIFVDRNPL
jgi:hypothetical protein